MSLTSPVVFFSWLFWWSRKETLVSKEGRLDTGNKQTPASAQVDTLNSELWCVQVRYLVEVLSIPLARLVFSSS